jgi:hypothetical protein
MIFRKPVATFRHHAPANKKPAGEKFSAGHTRPRPFSDLFNVAASRPAQMTTEQEFHTSLRPFPSSFL